MTPTPLDQLTFEELARRACEVMEYEVFILGGEELVRTGPKTYVSYSQWNLFGLAVEWIEARGVASPWFTTSPYNGKMEIPNKWCSVGMLSSNGVSYPAAAMRWVVEHGAKIKEAKP